MEIVAKEDDVKDPAKQMVEAQTGDDEPTKKDWSAHLKTLELT
jgi:hypothetical protein